jgi:hypothetical protein
VDGTKRQPRRKYRVEIGSKCKRAEESAERAEPGEETDGKKDERDLIEQVVRYYELRPIYQLRWTMSVHPVHNTQAATQAQAVSQAQSAEKQANQNSAIPVDKVTISAAAQAKQTALSIGADGNHDGE